MRPRNQYPDDLTPTPANPGGAIWGESTVGGATQTLLGVNPTRAGRSFDHRDALAAYFSRPD